MKIDQQHSRLDPAARVSAETGPQPVRTGGGAGGDAVRLSSDLRLADDAMRAATADESRSARVAEARAAYESGLIGTDLDRLADQMIDALLHSDDDVG
jgi:hypothetical protein